MTDRLNLSPRHRAVLVSLLQKHLPGVEVWAYASRVNGRSHDGSDLDLVLRGPDLTEIPIDQLMDFEEAIQESLIPFLVEARDWSRLPARFHGEIERDYVALGFGEPATTAEGPRRPDWTLLNLGQVCTKIGSGATPRGGKDVYLRHGPYSLIRSQNIYNDGFRADGLAYIGRPHASALKNVEVAREDVLLNITGDSVARVCQVRPGILPARVNQHVAIIRPDPAKLDPRFLRYALVSPETQATLLSWASSGATRNALTKGMIESLTVAAPWKVSDQQALAHILGTLDDKIEVNRRMNATLEAMARAVFTDWFVDFGPTRAKMEGRQAYLHSEIWDVFPDTLDDAGRPVGWKPGALREIADSPRRSIWPADVPGTTPYIGLEHMPRRSIALTEWEGAGKVASAKSAFRRGEFLFGKLRPYFHKVGFAALGGICSTDIVVVVPRAPEWAAFTLASLSSDDFVDYTHQASTGTRMPRTSWSTMSQYKVCLPADNVAAAFQHVAQPLIDRINVNVHESRTLTQVRDLLLPKLMSGALRVREANNAMDAVP